MVGLKTVTYANISLKMANPRNIAGNAEEDEAPNTNKQNAQGPCSVIV